jgi:hypothetical protein
MGLINKLSRQSLQRAGRHFEVECTYDVVSDEHGKRYLQLDTYGSIKREVPGKKSQSMRFSQEAIAQLKQILRDNNL